MLNVGNIVQWASDICLLAATLGCFYLVIAAALTFRFRFAERNPLTTSPPITVLVPLCGAEPNLYRRLSKLCSQNYPGSVQIICGSIDKADPAIDVVRQVNGTHPNHPIELHIDTCVHGANPKISNLINMVRHARYKTLMMIDSDIEVSPDHLSKMVAELQKPGIGAVTCLYQGITAGGFWAQLAALRINSDFLPSVIVGETFSLARPCFGACIVISNEPLQRIGGLEAFGNELWDDYAIGEAVRKLGYDVAIAPFTVDHLYTCTTMREWLANEFRAARTIRVVEPVGYAGSIITHPFPLALLASISYGKLAIALAFIALACRIIVWLSAEHRFHATSDNMLFVPFRELASFVIFIASFVGTSVTWRGQRYRLARQTFPAKLRT